MNGEYCIYLRKSRADDNVGNQTTEDVLRRHENALLELGRKMNLNITKIYREVVSGDTIASRPVVQEMLGAVESGYWDGVLVMEVERLARGDTIDQGIISQTFKYSDTKIITPVKTYNPNNEFDEEYFEFGLFMSRREYKIINRRLQRGRMASVNEGKYVGNKPPYGYDIVKLENAKGYTLAENDAEAQIVKLIFKLFTQGDSGSDRIGVSKICNKLQGMGIKPRISKTWSAATVRGILTNPVYIGKIRWNHRKTVNSIMNGQKVKTRPRSKDYILANGIHPPIISEEVFNQAQYYINYNRETPIGKNRRIANPLAGLIVCSECGHRMVRRPYQNKIPDGLICVTTGCKNVGSMLYLVEERILSTLREWLDGYLLNVQLNLQNDKSLEISVAKSKLSDIETELEKLDTQMSSLYDLLEQGIYSPDIFVERSQTIAEKRNALKEQRQFIKDTMPINNIDEEHSDFYPRVEKILAMYDEVEDVEKKNAMLKEIIEKVVYTKHKRGTSNNYDNFELIIYPKQPDSQIKSLPK